MRFAVVRLARILARWCRAPDAHLGSLPRAVCRTAIGARTHAHCSSRTAQVQLSQDTSHRSRAALPPAAARIAHASQRARGECAQVGDGHKREGASSLSIELGRT